MPTRSNAYTHANTEMRPYKHVFKHSCAYKFLHAYKWTTVLATVMQQMQIVNRKYKLSQGPISISNVVNSWHNIADVQIVDVMIRICVYNIFATLIYVIRYSKTSIIIVCKNLQVWMNNFGTLLCFKIKMSVSPDH